VLQIKIINRQTGQPVNGPDEQVRIFRKCFQLEMFVCATPTKKDKPFIKKLLATKITGKET
jgi:hypothetical protein